MSQRNVRAEQIDFSVPTFSELAQFVNPPDGMAIFVSDEDQWYAYDLPTTSWVKPKIDPTILELPIFYPITNINNFPTEDLEDGYIVLVKDTNILYRWDAPNSEWVAITQLNSTEFNTYARHGCRLVYDGDTTIKVDSGEIGIDGEYLINNDMLTIGWGDVELGTTQKADTWYYVYLEKDTNTEKGFKAFISETEPLLDGCDNVELSIDKDAFTRDYYPNNNYGNNSYVWASKGSCQEYIADGYIQFDLSQYSSSITSAKFKFYIYDTTNSGNGLKFYEVTEDWDESTITYNNRPASGNLVATAYNLNSSGWHEIDLTDYVNTKIVGDKKVNLRIEITASSTDIKFYSKEGYKPPTLKINNQIIVDRSSHDLKIHPTLNARFIGSFRTKSDSSIIMFNVIGDKVFLLTGYNYVLQGGNSTEKTAVDLSEFVPPTSSLGLIYYESDDDSSGYGDDDDDDGCEDYGYAIMYTLGCYLNDFLKFKNSSGQVSLPLHCSSIYYRCSSSNGSLSIGVHGYYEEV